MIIIIIVKIRRYNTKQLSKRFNVTVTDCPINGILAERHQRVGLIPIMMLENSNLISDIVAEEK